MTSSNCKKSIQGLGRGGKAEGGKSRVATAGRFDVCSAPQQSLCRYSHAVMSSLTSHSFTAEKGHTHCSQPGRSVSSAALLWEQELFSEFLCKINVLCDKASQESTN